MLSLRRRRWEVPDGAGHGAARVAAQPDVDKMSALRRRFLQDQNMSEMNPFGGRIAHLSPEEVKAGMADGSILLVDVREPNETAAERIPGAALVPLSTFDASDLPDPAGKRLVFSCRSGQRSQRAAAMAQAAGLPFEEHMQGGILGWKQAGFETEQG